MTFYINNYNELLDFIKREDINSEQATEVVCASLNVLCINTLKKGQLIKLTEDFIERFCKDNNTSRPIFLDIT